MSRATLYCHPPYRFMACRETNLFYLYIVSSSNTFSNKSFFLIFMYLILDDCIGPSDSLNSIRKYFTFEVKDRRVKFLISKYNATCMKHTAANNKYTNGV